MNATRLFQRRDLFSLLDKTLIGFSVIFLAYVLFVFFFQKPERLVQPGAQVDLEKDVQLDGSVADKPFEYYSEQFRKRDVFLGINLGDNFADAARRETDIIQNLKVVGTIVAKVPEAIVQDIQTKETFFLGIGDKIKEASVQGIVEGKVTLVYKGRTIEVLQPE